MQWSMRKYEAREMAERLAQYVGGGRVLADAIMATIDAHTEVREDGEVVRPDRCGPDLAHWLLQSEAGS